MLRIWNTRAGSTADSCWGNQSWGLFYSWYHVLNTLANMYSQMWLARRFCEGFRIESEGLDSMLCCFMIAAYRFHGQGVEATKMFKWMGERLCSNDLTLLSLFYSSTHCGLEEKKKWTFIWCWRNNSALAKISGH